MLFPPFLYVMVAHSLYGRRGGRTTKTRKEGKQIEIKEINLKKAADRIRRLEEGKVSEKKAEINYSESRSKENDEDSLLMVKKYWRRLEENTPKIHYLCNGEQEGCERRNCYKTNGDSELSVCRHTPDIRYAMNFSKLPYEASGYWEGIQQSRKNEDADTKKQ